MPLGAGDIANYRDRERTQKNAYMSNVGSFSTTYLTISGVQVHICGESGNALESLHTRSIRTAVADLVAAGYPLPPLDFYLTSSAAVPNVAMKTYKGNNPAPIIFLGPKMWAKNPSVQSMPGLVGGVGGAGGVRGIANQAYDGTTRWFGNPKQKAQGATIVIHELGHVLHEISNPGIFWEEQRAMEARPPQPSPNAAGWRAVATAVSHYAGNNQLEFVAEVFAGRRIGKNYSAAVNTAYTALGGP